MIIYTDDVQAQLELSVQRFKKAINFEKENIDLLYNAISQYDKENRNVMIYYLNNSLIVSVYGKMEAEFSSLCFWMQRAVNIGISQDDIQGSGIPASLRYLQGLLLITNNIMKSIDKKKIDCWRIIRNSIAHNNDVLEINVNNKRSRKSLSIDMNFIDKHIGVNHDDGLIIARKEDVLKMLKDFEMFIEKIKIEVIKRITENKEAP